MKSLYSKIVLGTLVLALALASCAPAPTTPGLRVGTATEAPEAWLGPSPHLVLVGRVNGVDVRVSVNEGPLLDNLKAKREFQVLGDQKRYTAFEVSFGALMEGLERELELEFENADFGTRPLGEDLGLVAQANEELAPEGLDGPRSNLEFEWEWEDAAASSFASGEVLSAQGRLVRSLDGEGIGGWFTATFADGQLTGSFTVPQVEDEADDVDAFYR